ncbi:urease accessory protein UreE [Pseudomonas putida]|jgi:urease accessory protein|uniref:Urease accessory protein UreE n=2 Tax=Pseudomonas putida group TaxID=136845 RepID=A0A1X1A9B0_PSEPU|nr:MULTISPECIES: urease accessory protein UreE [Pseudomonas]WHH49980.1 urease accessory protein UreE [Pseudomonas sp. Ap32]EKT4454291.1 urease accessory protein UreE [Pseudomonas putida]EKT4469686.1 urease accessory protein UreE [Pseudomonas putida]EKT4493273.1 urease accessory protein UreE [Pseudomonas putida]EKT4511106.1 urease accessory protein UreE [Pseudomonas putida]
MIVLNRRISEPGTRVVSGTVTLDVDSRIKSRLRVTLDDGREAGLMLERGHLLRGGELLADAEGTQLIRVLAAPEAVSTVRCTDPHLLARAAYHLGNRHVPLQIEPGLLRFQHDHVLDDMLRGLGLTVEAEQAPFEPEAGAYQSAPHGHSHSHAHGHDHPFVRLPAHS